MPLKRLPLKAKVIQNSKEPRKLKFLGYSGDSVDLNDLGFDAPVVYDLDTLRIKNQRIPMMYNHRTDIGQTTRITNDKKQVDGIGELKEEGKLVERIKNASKDGFPYEASMGLDARNIRITYHKNGLEANGKNFTGPHYLIKNSLLDEITITPEGRDRKTEVHLLSKLTRMELSAIKEPKMKKKPKPAPTRKPAPPVRRSTERKPEERRIENKRKVATFGELLRLNNKYPDYVDMIAEGADRGYSFKKIENMVKLAALEDNLPTPPRTPGGDGADDLEARIVAALSHNPEKLLEKSYGAETRDRIMNMGQIGLKEMLVIAANRLGQNFSGHSDVDRLIDFMGNANLGRIHNTSGFSSFSMPNLFKRATELVLEDAWIIEGFFAPEMCTAESHNDFKKVQRIRPSGGTMWDGLDANGRIKHGFFGKEHTYEAQLDTKAQMIMFNREDIENDDFGAIQSIMDLFMEGSMIVPDYKLLQRMLQPNGSFFTAVGASPNHFSLALNATNLETVYLAVQSQTINKGQVSWNQQISDEWYLVYAPAKEKEVWELINQGILISPVDTTTQRGERNYWFGKVTPKKFQQLSNTTMHADASSDTWFLWPKGQKYSPFSISYLRGRRRPIVKTVDAPIDMLGFGVVGVFDINVNDREPRSIARSSPTADFTS